MRYRSTTFTAVAMTAFTAVAMVVAVTVVQVTVVVAAVAMAVARLPERLTEAPGEAPKGSRRLLRIHPKDSPKLWTFLLDIKMTSPTIISACDWPIA